MTKKRSTLEEKNKVKELGGLFVIGSERHESHGELITN